MMPKWTKRFTVPLLVNYWKIRIFVYTNTPYITLLLNDRYITTTTYNMLVESRIVEV